MITLSMLALAATVIYLGLGLTALRRNPRSSLNRLFATLCLAYGLWALGFGFMYSSPSKEACWAWDRVASLGWVFFPALVLHCCLVMGRREEWLARPWTFIAIYLPGLVMFVGYQLMDLGTQMDYQRLPLGWSPDPGKILPWFWYYESYMVLFIGTSLGILVRWARTTTRTRERRQGRALIAACIIAFVVSVAIDFGVEKVVGQQLPPLSPILGVIWAGGIAWVMSRHRLMEVNPASASGQILQSVRDLLLLVDGKGVVDANPQALLTLGYARNDLVGGASGRVFGGDEKARKVLQSTRDLNTAAFPVELAWLRKDGSGVPVWLWGAPIFDHDGDWIGAVLVGRDLSERRRVEEELARASGIESMGLLAGGVAHDLNNLLAGVIGHLELAREAAPPDPRLLGRLDDAEAAADMARRLAQRLLSFHRGEAPERRAVDVGRLVKETSGLALRGSKARLEIRIPPDVRPVLVDEGQLTQVLQNLLINARQAMPEGGRITVEVENLTGAPAPVPGGAELDPGEYVCLTVRDEGPGFPDEVRARLFEPFFTTKAGGSGLGLASSRSIVRRHGGDIRVSPPDGRGAKVQVLLPAAG